MELRSYSNLHFIKAITGDQVIKTLNVIRGKPRLLLRNVSDLYDIKVRPKDEFGGFMVGRDNFEVERSCITLEESNVKNEPETSASDDVSLNYESKVHLDDDDIGNLTLKQIKERCKIKKRKHSQSLNSSKGTGEMSSNPNEKSSDLKIELDDFDLMEPLIKWRSKLPMTKKAKTKCIKTSTSASSQETVSIVKVEDSVDSHICKPQCGDFTALEVKQEAPEPCWEMVTNEVSEIVYGGVLENELSICSTNEHELSGVNGVCYEYPELADFMPPQVCYDQHNELMSFNSGTTLCQSLALPLIEFGNEGCKDMPNIPKTFPLGITLVEEYNDTEDNPSKDTSLWNTDGDTGIQLPDGATGSFKSMDQGDGDDGGHHCKDELTHDTETKTRTSSVNSCLSPERHFSIADNSPATAKEKLCSSSSHADATDELGIFENENLCCSTVHNSPTTGKKQTLTSAYTDDNRHHYDTPNESTKFEDEDSDYSNFRSPKRLLSARKVISPTSQRRLCEAMQSIELQDENNLKCQEKLCFGQLSGKKIGVVSERPNRVMKAGCIVNPKQIIRKAKDTNERSKSEGTIKVPPNSPPAQHIRNEIACKHSCSQSVIAFSQRQMRDIECLATKLTEELNSMKGVVVDMLYSESSATSSKYKLDEARMAVTNAKRAEETAKRWLTRMARDCNRFCKIMNLRHDSSFENAVEKGRKKIAFADEAGGKLCHVRFYHDDAVFPLGADDKK